MPGPVRSPVTTTSSIMGGGASSARLTADDRTPASQAAARSSAVGERMRALMSVKEQPQRPSGFARRQLSQELIIEVDAGVIGRHRHAIVLAVHANVVM